MIQSHPSPNAEGTESMSGRMACLAGEAVYGLRDKGSFAGEAIGRRQTPFGTSEVIFEIHGNGQPYYLLCPHGAHRYEVSAGFVNHRANLYALKDLGVQTVVSFAAAGAISHNYGIGDLVVAGDVIDRTTRRPTTFFENTGMGVLRQFPVFCPALREAMTDCLDEMNVKYHRKGTLVVSEGPRLETPAEIRFLAAAGGHLVGHSFVPEAFLAKELQMCYAGVAYVANYAETGSHQRPFSTADLFGGLAAPDDAGRRARAVETIGRLVERLSQVVPKAPAQCTCDQTMARQIEQFGLPEDFRLWFPPPPAGGAYEPTAPQGDRLAKPLAGRDLRQRGPMRRQA